MKKKREMISFSVLKMSKWSNHVLQTNLLNWRKINSYLFRTKKMSSLFSPFFSFPSFPFFFSSLLSQIMFPFSFLQLIESMWSEPIKAPHFFREGNAPFPPHKPTFGLNYMCLIFKPNQMFQYQLVILKCFKYD